MKDTIYVVTQGSSNCFFTLQFAFETQEEAEKCRAYFDRQNGASSKGSTIHFMKVYKKFEFDKDVK